MIKSTGNLVITRPEYGDGRKAMNIRLSDKNGAKVVEVEMTYESFVVALTSGFAACSFDFYEKSPVGKVHEQKIETLSRPKSRTIDGKRNAEFDELLAPHEVDGWKAYVPDLSNQHRWTGKDQVSVTFHRYVDAADKT